MSERYQDQPEKTCEVYVTSDGYQCGNYGHIHSEMPLNYCTYCGAYVEDIIDEGDPNDECIGNEDWLEG